MNWFRAFLASADSLALIEAKIDSMATIIGAMFLGVRRRLDKLEDQTMSPEQEQLIVDVRALIAALSSPVALSEAQAQVALLTADLTAATTDNAQLREIITQAHAAALELGTDNDRLTDELQAVKERLAPPADTPEGSPV